ncbi:SAUR-like auxin-responsive protein family [Raphanus sativus]|uniref:Protein SMALL AUXIN UP-REGULATED RNA 12 n=1 Tax=Raphanus sativus TaxID=3726 RepID=A0A9W3C151_RAPSA|nr:protein SMALL AUXIN UP-REGULATED RNA 12 [Raphanus sativus]KAJ4891800.1 SAUR-like auxin-responsive protein family [Raphanus sativus]
MKSKLIKSWEKKLKMMTGKVITPCTLCKTCCQEIWWALKREAEMIPKDVPKGHLVVYVGEESRRFVINISLLTHPLFKALLDQAQDAYGFSSADSRLWIPCDVSDFLDLVRCAVAPQHQNKCMCI